MATETNLTKVNIFPSASSYNTNKNGLGAGELALIPFLNPNGISDQSDVDTGYIILNNGLKIQWGYSDTNYSKTTVSLHIPFNSDAYCVYCTTYFNSEDGGGVDHYTTINGKTETNFVVSSSSTYTGVHWLAIGK